MTAACRPSTDLGNLVQVHDDRDVFRASGSAESLDQAFAPGDLRYATRQRVISGTSGRMPPADGRFIHGEGTAQLGGVPGLTVIAERGQSPPSTQATVPSSVINLANHGHASLTLCFS